MSLTLKQTRESMEVHTVFVIYENGKPLFSGGRIAYEREQDAKTIITTKCRYEAQTKSGTWQVKDPLFKQAENEARKRFDIIPYRAVT